MNREIVAPSAPFHLKTADASKPAPSGEDPIALFQSWFDQAVTDGVKEPRAMTVATVDADGSPDARMMLFKSVDARGFTFYTNMQSRKAKQLGNEGRVALCFYWSDLGKQVRVRGRTEMVTDDEADAYFATRPRLSQISAWASKQSTKMRGYFEFEGEVAKATVRFGLGRVPRPPFWSGFRVFPEQIEFWMQKPFRRHQRILYTRVKEGWTRDWLYP